MKVHEFSLPTVVGRVSIHISAGGRVFTPPVFWLRSGLPPGHGQGFGEGESAIGTGSGRQQEGNGGVVGWGELLCVKRRQAVERERECERGRSGGGERKGMGQSTGDVVGGEDGEGECEGEWNRREMKEIKKGWTLGMRKGDETRWRHTRRPRSREGVAAGAFF